MFGFFYPENGERFLASLSFATAEEAIAYFKDKRSTWLQIEPQNPKDKAAFENSRMGDIVVVRQVED